ncbi:MAG: glutamine--fructose-6-phosphate aminotransferase, partial [Dehalococcoidia bacterium]
LVQEGDTEVASIAHQALALPLVPEFLTPIVYLVPLQLFTYWLALDQGRNPDLFRLDDPQHQAARTHYTL